MSGNPLLKILYRNHRGEVAVREVQPWSVYYGTSEHHPGVTDWFLMAWDEDRKTTRTFLMVDILAIGEVAVERLSVDAKRLE